MGLCITLPAKQYSVIVVANLVVCTQQVRAQGLQRRFAIIVHMKCQRLTVISVARQNPPNGDNGESFTCVMPVELRLGEILIATTIGQCLGK